MSLHIHRSERADALADGLAELLSRPLDDPFATEIVAVPTRGVERWLAQSLATRLGAADGRADGVCAGVDFLSPARLSERALAGALELDRRDDPWRADRLTWPVLAEMEAARDEPWAAVLWSFLAGRGGSPDSTSQRTGRRWSTAAHVAGLYERYAVQRPEMILAWHQSRDVGPGGGPLTAEFAWQPALWRRVRAALDVASPAERLPRACEALVADPDSSDLPPRVSVFGATRLDSDQLRVLDALARQREVHLWLNHPSPRMWSQVAQRLATAGPVSGPRRDDPTVTVPRHRLLAYLGRDVRELQLLLAGGPTPVEDEPRPGLSGLPSAEAAGRAPGGGRRGGGPRTSLLARLQDDLSADEPARAADQRPVLAADDSSIQLHVSHGPDRQVEVLREVLLGLLDDDPTLEPRDIVVLCPDIETFAPLIAATFGLDSGPADDVASSVEHPGHRLRVRLADRSLRRINPLLSVLDRLLDLADSRLPASALLDLAASPPVARRFGFSEDDQQRLAELVEISGVRWGQDAEHRRRYGLDSFGQNTWAAGLDRMLLGVAMDAEGDYFIDTALPLDEVDSGDVELVGRLAELIARVGAFSRAVGDPAQGSAAERHPLDWWMATCRDSLESLTSVPAADSWQSAHAYGELARLAEQSAVTLVEAAAEVVQPAQPADAGLSLADVRALLADAFRGRATRANFRTGTLTMCTMLPMRSVPHRVICLLGVDDDAFPRHRVADGDDIVALEPWIGDRDPRSEDRQLLLDAVMAAEERLVVVYSGIDARTGATKPVAVPVGELLDALDETAATPDGRPVRELLSTRHTLQPFDRGNFVPDALGNPQSFDVAALRGAVAAAAERQPPPDLYSITDLAPHVPADDIALADLIRFFSHPAKALLRIRAGLYLREDQETPPEQIPIAPDGLETWSIGNRLLQRRLEGIGMDQLVGAEWRRGDLPPRALGSEIIGKICERVEELAAAAEPFVRGATPVARDVEVQLETQFGARTLAGTIPAVHGEQIVTVLFSWLAAKQRLQSWIQLLALTATTPEVSWRAVTVGRGGTSVLGPVSDTFARLVLADLVTLFDTGHDEPLPFAPKTSEAYARIRRKDQSVTALSGKIEKEWLGDSKRPGERDADFARFFPASLADLLAQRAGAEDVRGALGEPSRFGSIARRVWQPLLMCEETR